MKHRKWKWIIGLMLAAALVAGALSGCSGNGTGEGTGGDSQGSNAESSGGQAMGRFLEEEVDTGVVLGNIYDMKRLEDGTVRIIGSDGDNGLGGVWDSKDEGKTWEKAYDLPTEIQSSDNGYMDYAALSPDGQAVCAFNEIGDGGINPVLYLIDKDGKAGKIPFELPKEEGGLDAFAVQRETQLSEDDIEQPEGNEEQPEGNEEQPENNGEQPEDEGFVGISNMIFSLQFPNNEQVVLQDGAGIVYQVNVSDGSVQHTYEFDTTIESYQIFAVGNTLVAQNTSQVLLYDMQTGEQKNSEEALNKGTAENGFFYAVDTMDTGESIYCLSRGGLYHYKFGGSVMEQLIEGSMNTLGSPVFYPIAVAMLDEQNLLVAASDTSSGNELGISVLKYAYSADTPAKPDMELKVYSLYDNKEIRQSISRFQKEHLDVYVNYQVALSEDNGVTVSDALKTLTTEIMAGNGPDVLLLDGMPVKSYIEKGVLKDLSGLMEESGGNYFENIINAYQDDQGQMCAVPARFLIPMLHADSAYYSPGEDFDAFTERKDTMVNMDPKTVVEKFWYTCGAAWQKDDKTLDEAKVTEFLTKLKNAYGEYDSSLEDTSIAVGMTEAYGATEMLQDISLSRGDFELAFGKWNTNFGLCGSMDYGMQQAVNEKLKDGKRDLMPGQADHVFVPSVIMGISSKSAQPETAEDFVKYLFSQEAQKVSQSGGFPVEKDAFRSVIDGHQYEGKESLVGVGSSGDNMDEFLDYAMIPTPEEEIAKLTELAASLTTPALGDDVIKDAVTEQGEKVLKGEISPEEGADAIMQKVNIYLAE